MTFFINPVEQTTSDSKEIEFRENDADIIDFNTVSYDRKQNGFETPTETEIEVDAVVANTCHPTQSDVSMSSLLDAKRRGIFEIATNRVKGSQSIKKCVKGSLILVLVSVCFPLIMYNFHSQVKSSPLVTFIVQPGQTDGIFV